MGMEWQRDFEEGSSVSPDVPAVFKSQVARRTEGEGMGPSRQRVLRVLPYCAVISIVSCLTLPSAAKVMDLKLLA